MMQMVSREHVAGATDPALSVVVIMFSTREQLVRCLDALAEQATRIDLEVVVPHDDALDRPDDLRAAYPGIQLLRLAGRRPPAVTVSL